MSVTKIPLTHAGDAWVELSQVDWPCSFEELWALHPQERGKVIMHRKGRHLDVECSRWHQSYGRTPPWDPERSGSSYMFSGQEPPPQQPLPSAFQPFLDWINQQNPEKGYSYNQVVVNWYDEKDFIPLHADYEVGMRPGADIVVWSFNERPHDDAMPQRLFRVQVKRKHAHEARCDDLQLALRHGTLIRMCGSVQKKFRHGVAAVPQAGKRISLTFRSFE